MLAKIPDKRSDGKSSFKQALDYMRYAVHEHTGEVTERGISWISDSCLDVSIIYEEMAMVAAMNYRVDDPVFHYILSWPANEIPTREQWEDCVKKTLVSLGLSEHQACATPHTDTDKFHVHIIASRIHPDTYRSHSPEWSHRSLDKALRELEKQYGWREDHGLYRWDEATGKPVKTEKEILEKWAEERKLKERPAQGKAGKKEIYGDTQSLLSYCKGDPAKRLNDLFKSKDTEITWQKIHAELANFGLCLHSSEKGGFTVSNEDSSIHVKASDAFRNHFSGKPAQQWREKNLGKFQLPDESLFKPEIKSQYKSDRVSKRDPVLREQRAEGRRLARQDLLQRYKLSKLDFEKKALVGYEVSKDRLGKQLILLSQGFKQEKANLRMSDLPSSLRQLEKGCLIVEHERRVAGIKSQLKVFKAQAKYLHREEWIAEQAELGDSAAISYLRGQHYAEQRRKKEAEKEAEFAIKPAVPGQHDPRINAFENLSWRFDRANAAVVYTIDNKTAFTDRGNSIDLAAPNELTDEVVLAALKLAQGKYGQKLTVAGSAEFQQRVALLALKNKLHIAFTDPAMQQIMTAPQQKPVPIEREENERANIGSIANNVRAAGRDIKAAGHHVNDIEGAGIGAEQATRNQHARRTAETVVAAGQELRGIIPKIARTVRAATPVVNRLATLNVLKNVLQGEGFTTIREAENEGSWRGRIRLRDGFVVQELGQRVVVIHDPQTLAFVPKEGEFAAITYRNGCGAVLIEKPGQDIGRGR